MRRLYLWLILVGSLASVLLLRIYPLTIIQPFKHQSPEPLQRALFVLRIAPAAAIIVAFIALLAVVLGWRKVRIWGRAGAIAVLVLICGVAVLTRINIFELMFHPAGGPKLLTIAQAKIAPEDMLIAVTLNGDAHAYPILEMAYHHVSNDYVGGVPIVATY
jgi:hypothetical protein